MRRTVTVDFINLQWLLMEQIPVAFGGLTYEVWCGKSGNLVCLLPGHLSLGIREGDFEIVEFHYFEINTERNSKAG